jgi:hypothetical protein
MVHNLKKIDTGLALPDNIGETAGDIKITNNKDLKMDNKW